ncbi:conserved hypothetical protein [Ricinus communis]|uniref:Uncharacterized protein n=1 Tax=Ricinus communis TaxID=3988 RepID=B9S3N6_RICCO|nr:conserved hypothetical protein [Ricinus communis]
MKLKVWVGYKWEACLQNTCMQSLSEYKELKEDVRVMEMLHHDGKGFGIINIYIDSIESEEGRVEGNGGDQSIGNKVETIVVEGSKLQDVVDVCEGLEEAKE